MLALTEMWPQDEDETEPSPQSPHDQRSDRSGGRAGGRGGGRTGGPVGEQPTGPEGSGGRPGAGTGRPASVQPPAQPGGQPRGHSEDELESEQSAAVRRTRIGDAPEQFLWRGRLYLVRTVLEHDPGRVERWQVAAAAGAFMPTGVFSLEFDWTAGTWAVYRLPDEVWEQVLGRGSASSPESGTAKAEESAGDEGPGEAER